MTDLLDQLRRCALAIPYWIAWKLDHAATQLAATNAYQSADHKAARVRERESFARLMDRLQG